MLSWQNLPSLILERILDFTVDDFPRYLAEKEKCVCIPYVQITTILHLCSTWRSAALSKLYNEVWWYNPSYNYQCYKSSCHDRRLPRGLPLAIATGNADRVKKIILYWKSESVLDGSAIKAVRSSSFSRMTFPSVTSLDFRFCCSNDLCDNVNLDTTDSAIAFCTEIYRLFPNAQSYQLSEFYGFGRHHNRPFVITLKDGLVAHKSLTDYSVPDFFNFLNLPADGRSLRNVSFSSCWDGLLGVQLIRRSAASLEYIKFCSWNFKEFTELLPADDDMAIVYPKVHSLELRNFSSYHHGEALNLFSPAGAPFPSLRRLVIEGRYPFKNDVLFRDSEATLEYLGILLLPKTISDLAAYGVFDANRFPALKYVRGEFSSMDGDAAHLLSTRSLFRLGTNASIIVSRLEECLFDDIGFDMKGFGRNITALDVPSIRFTVIQTFQLIKTLPFLRRLQTGIEVTDELRSSDRTHDVCIGQCRPLWFQRHANDLIRVTHTYSFNDNPGDGVTKVTFRPISYEEFHSPPSNSFEFFRGFFMDHLDLIYADLGFIATHYADFYPLSETLTVLDYSRCSQDSVEFLARSRMAAILIALCPSIQRIQKYSDMVYRYSRSLTFDDIFIDRQTVEESDQHKRFVAHLISNAE